MLACISGIKPIYEVHACELSVASNLFCSSLWFMLLVLKGHMHSSCVTSIYLGRLIYIFEFYALIFKIDGVAHAIN